MPSSNAWIASPYSTSSVGMCFNTASLARLMAPMGSLSASLSLYIAAFSVSSPQSNAASTRSTRTSGILLACATTLRRS